MDRIVFHKVAKVTELVTLLVTHFEMSAEKARFLIEYGAIYSNTKRVTLNREVTLGEILRIHLQPKRYRADQVNWAVSIICQHEDYVAINKPKGIPVGPTLDNVKECCQMKVADIVPSVLVTTRLDVGTSGVLIFAKNKSFLREFNLMVASGRLRKTYLALTQRKPKLGVYIHYMQKEKRAPKRVFEQPEKGRQRCELEILKVERFEEFYITEILLVTGRTHQIRVQFEALGHSIVNDRMYGDALEGLGDNEIGLHCKSLEFQWAGETHRIDAGLSWPALESAVE